MRPALLALVLATATSSACITPSVVSQDERAIDLADVDVEWRAGVAEDLTGTFVSTEVTGAIAASVRKLVYLFSSDGTYTGSALLDGDPPHFEVITGSWSLDEDGLRLDGAPAARLEIAPDGSLRLTGEDGRVVLRRERDA